MIKVVGMGPGNSKYLTMEAIEEIKSGEKVIAFGRISKTAKEFTDNLIEVKTVDEIIENIDKDKVNLILASGDPCFYGIIDYLTRRDIIIDKIIPGISSFQYMMAKLKKSWQGAKLLSLHGRIEDLSEVKKAKTSIILTDSKNTPGEISKNLFSLGIIGSIYAGFNLSYEDEIIIHKKIGEEIKGYNGVALVVVENEMA